MESQFLKVKNKITGRTITQWIGTRSQGKGELLIFWERPFVIKLKHLNMVASGTCCITWAIQEICTTYLQELSLSDEGLWDGQDGALAL